MLAAESYPETCASGALEFGVRVRSAQIVGAVLSSGRRVTFPRGIGVRILLYTQFNQRFITNDQMVSPAATTTYCAPSN